MREAKEKEIKRGRYEKREEIKGKEIIDRKGMIEG